jgi:hypothetical protein
MNGISIGIISPTEQVSVLTIDTNYKSERWEMGEAALPLR